MQEKLFAQKFTLRAKVCNMYRVYCPNYILNEWEVNWKRYFLQKECWNAIDYLRANMNYQKFSNSLQIIGIHNKGQALQNFTSMVDTRGLTDSASLKIITHNGRNSGGHNWPKTILGGACCLSVCEHLSYCIGWCIHHMKNSFILTNGNTFQTHLLERVFHWYQESALVYVCNFHGSIPIASRLCTWYVAKFGYVVQITKQTG